jgi:major membrane immunogen (membrane-anchored lipoprotein)
LAFCGVVLLVAVVIIVAASLLSGSAKGNRTGSNLGDGSRASTYKSDVGHPMRHQGHDGPPGNDPGAWSQ